MPAGMYPWIKGGRDAPTWNPTQEEIKEMEASFDNLAKLKPDHDCCNYMGAFIFHPDDYYMQYAAVVLNGHACIYINAFRELRKGWIDGWQKEWVTAKGGGHNYWQALYEPATKTFSKLTFNAAE